jgi:hypothetical protein
MNRTLIHNLFSKVRTAAVVVFAAISIFSGSAIADEVKLDMEGTTATIPKGNTITRRIFGIAGFSGSVKLKMKWHAVNIVPSFNPLRVELKHGDFSVLPARSCFSVHAPADRTPKCSFDISITQAEANRPGNWTLVVTNNSDFEVMGFNIEKEAGELNPLVPTFRSVYTPNCPNTVNLDMEGTTLTLGKGNTQERRISGIGSANGDVVLKMKWHAVTIIPNTFNALRVEVMNGTNVVASQTCFSIHSNKTPKCEFRFQSGSRPPGEWKLRITNNSNDEVMGFNISKQGDINPLVPSFNSTYKANCP